MDAAAPPVATSTAGATMPRGMQRFEGFQITSPTVASPVSSLSARSQRCTSLLSIALASPPSAVVAPPTKCGDDEVYSDDEEYSDDGSTFSDDDEACSPGAVAILIRCARATARVHIDITSVLYSCLRGVDLAGVPPPHRYDLACNAAAPCLPHRDEAAYKRMLRIRATINCRLWQQAAY
jgi:hypothetical protein